MAGVMLSTTEFAQHTLEQVLILNSGFYVATICYKGEVSRSGH